jgi:hypothetical protein
MSLHNGELYPSRVFAPCVCIVAPTIDLVRGRQDRSSFCCWLMRRVAWLLVLRRVFYYYRTHYERLIYNRTWIVDFFKIVLLRRINYYNRIFEPFKLFFPFPLSSTGKLSFLPLWSNPCPGPYKTELLLGE